MRKLMQIALWLTFVLAMSACRSGGGAAESPPRCPVLSPVPPHLMQSPSTEKRVRAELFSPLQSATPTSDPSKK